MGNEHKSSEVILEEIEGLSLKIAIGARYVHYKGLDKIYLVKGFGTLESNDELCVIYRAEYGDKLTFIRPVSVWLEDVEWEGKAVPRFKLIR